MRLKISGLCLTLSLLAACSSSPVDQSAATGAGATMNAAVPGSSEDFVQNVGDRVFFAYDRYDVSDQGQAVLHKQAEWLQQYPSTLVIVEGHCDERGTREYNLALGERRANAVKNYLLSLGVDAGRLEVISYGKERPFAVGSNEEAYAQNRAGRTVIK